MFSVEDIVSESRWIFVNCDFYYDPEEFTELVKYYQTQLTGNVFKGSERMQFGIDNDPLHLVFQWDSCFGITVVVPTDVDIEVAKKTLQDLCNSLNKLLTN